MRKDKRICDPVISRRLLLDCSTHEGFSWVPGRIDVKHPNNPTQPCTESLNAGLLQVG